MEGALANRKCHQFLPLTALLEYSDYFFTVILYILCKFYKVSFGGQNILTHLLIDNRRWMRDYTETTGAQKRIETNGLKLGLRKCEKLKFFEIALRYYILFFYIAVKI